MVQESHIRNWYIIQGMLSVKKTIVVLESDYRNYNVEFTSKTFKALGFRKNTYISLTHIHNQNLPDKI